MYGNQEIENIITNQKIMKAEPLDEEVKFDHETLLITETDLNGLISYTNAHFREMTGFTQDELIGSPHSIIRHPDMPKGLFNAMWRIIAHKKVWRGYVKNMRKDGRYYWALLYVQPKVNEEGRLVGYSSTSRYAYSSTRVDMEKMYEELKGDEYIDDPFFMSSILYLSEDLATRG